jgi:signal transduction histidine kinase
MVEVVVSDDGPGVSNARTDGFGIGLSNVRDRLAARFGAEASIDSGPAGRGYRTVIRLPKVLAHG